jgi:hypothetical protein
MRHNVSIREAKEVIRAHIENSSEGTISFASVYNFFLERDSFISPALCFLTVLHLANERNYALTQGEGEFNFAITRNDP